MKKILFPTDFSEVSKKAFVYALHLANQLDASITTLHTYEKPDVGDFVMPASLSDFYEGLDWNEFENYKSSIPNFHQIALENNLGNININHALEEGDTVQVITRIAKSENYDLIVMGTGGASILKEIFVGTLAGEVMEEAECPVIAIPEKAVFDGRIDKIGVTIEYSMEDAKVLSRVLELAKALNAEVKGIHIDIGHTGDLTNKINDFKEAYKEYHYMSFVELSGDDIVEATAGYAEENNIDLLVMVTHKRTFIQELFSFSHAKKMTYQHKIPVYGIPEGIL
jgi:nucleotide-binding universal stress UspA family protein